MIICHKYKFIFLKTRKTAGSSVEIALSRLCDDHDIVTTIAEEKLRQEEGGRVGKNIKKSWYQYSPKDIIKILLPSKKPEPNLLRNHVEASQVKRYLFPEIWNNYLKITIERNPWDKAISHYYWAKKGKENFRSLSEHLYRVAEKHPHALSNWNIYTINNKIAVDRVLFYEQLTENLSNLAKDLGVKELRLPHKKAKGNYRKDKRHYKELLSESDADLIREVCQREIDAFGYEF